MIIIIQLQFLNHILKTQDYSIVTLNSITSDYFPAYDNEFKYIKNHFDKYGNVPDKATFLSVFPNFDIVEVKESPAYLLDELYKDRKTRYLTGSFNKIRDLIMDYKIEDAESLLSTIVTNVPQYNKMNTIDLLSDTSRYNNYVEKCNNYTKYYVKTGFNELDTIIGGWDRKEDVVTIAARSGVGKSFFLFKCAVAAAEQGLNVGIYSGEMSENKVGYRIDTLISHISNGKIIHGNSSIQTEYQEHLREVKNKIKGTIKILTPNMIGGPAGVSDLRAFIEKDNLDILCVDQHSLLEDDRKAKNPVEKAANISKDLKNLQVMKQIPILAVSQQNRSAVSESGVGTEHIAQADRIAQDSTVIIFLEQSDGVLTVHLVKSRDSGGNKSLKYKIDYDKGLYTYIPEGDADDVEEVTQEMQDLKMYYEPDSIISGGNPF